MKEVSRVTSDMDMEYSSAVQAEDTKDIGKKDWLQARVS